jgi:glycosyltransferase involved in cell wall biosynthesis
MNCSGNIARNRPRVLFVNNQGLATIGGGPTILRHLALGLTPDFDVTVLSYEPPADDLAHIRQIFVPPPPRFKAWRFGPLLRAKYLRDAVPASEIDAADIVVILDPHFARLPRRTKQQRLVYLSLSCVARQEWFASRQIIGALFAAQYAYLEHRIAAAADVVIVSSNTHGRELGRFACVAGLRPIVLYPVFNIAEPPPRRDERSGTIVLLGVGRLVAVKNYQSIVELASRVTDLDCRFVIAGEGGDLKELSDAVTAAGLSDRVVFIGPTSDIGSLLATADLFVHPSRYESFGIVIYEAMRAGVVPVCSSKSVCGIRELLTPNVDSIFVDFDAPDRAAAVIRELIADRKQCKNLGAAAQTTAAKISAGDYVGEFRKILSSREIGARA